MLCFCLRPSRAVISLLSHAADRCDPAAQEQLSRQQQQRQQAPESTAEPDQVPGLWRRAVGAFGRTKRGDAGAAADELPENAAMQVRSFHYYLFH